MHIDFPFILLGFVQLMWQTHIYTNTISQFDESIKSETEAKGSVNKIETVNKLC